MRLNFKERYPQEEILKKKEEKKKQKTKQVQLAMNFRYLLVHIDAELKSFFAIPIQFSFVELPVLATLH